MGQHAPEPGTDDPFVGEPPAGDATPGEYTSRDQQAGVSEETGTTYERWSGEPELTPHDQELLEQEQEEEL